MIQVVVSKYRVSDRKYRLSDKICIHNVVDQCDFFRYEKNCRLYLNIDFYEKRKGSNDESQMERTMNPRDSNYQMSDDNN